MWKYIGNGSFLAGVPACDMTDEECAEYAKAFEAREGVPLRDAPEFSTLYKHVTERATSARTDDGEE